jgi:hypothetical protein
MNKLNVVSPISQRNSIWSKILLGYNSSIFTIGSHGCLITSICHYLQSLGYDVNPQELNKKLKDNNGYLPGGGLLIFEALNKIFPEISLSFTSKRYVGIDTPDSFFNDMRRSLDAGHYLLCEVDFSPTQVGEQMHWVGVYGYTDDKDFLIMNPWTGEFEKLSVYGELKLCTYSFRYYSETLKNASQTEDACLNVKDELDTLKNTVEGIYKPKITHLEGEILRLQNKEFTLSESTNLWLSSVGRLFGKLSSK